MSVQVSIIETNAVETLEYKVTNITFFDQSYTNQTGENEFERVAKYSSNITINDSFIIHASGDEGSCDWSIPTGAECFWKSIEAQDNAYDNLEDLVVANKLEGQDIENNFNWLSENANEIC